MKFWHALAALLLAISVGFIASCGDASDDPSITPTPSPTPTQTPNPCGDGECPEGKSCVCEVCLSEGQTLDDRTFTLARPGSHFLSSALGGADLSFDPWLDGPLVLRAGRPDPAGPPAVEFPDDVCETPPGPLPVEASCSAPLALAEDGLFGFNDPLLATICVKLFAQGSVGFIDCDGGTAHAVVTTIDSMGAAQAGPVMLCRNQGDPFAGPGAATLRIERSVTIRVPHDPDLGPRSAAELCPLLNYDDPFEPAQIAQFNIDVAEILVSPLLLSTQTSEGEVLNPQGAPTVFLPPVQGENFLCSRFSEADSPGGLVANLPILDNPITGGDTMSAFVLFDHAPSVQ